MVVSDQVFEAYLKCKTKAYQLFLANPGRPRPDDSISQQQQKIRDDFCQKYVTSLVSENPNACLFGAKTTDKLKIRGYQWIVSPAISFGNLVSNPPLLEIRSFPLKKASSGCIPIRIFPSEQIHDDQKQLLAFDALVLGKATGHFPTVGKIVHGRQHEVVRIKLTDLIPKVEALVGDLHAMLEKEIPPSFALIRHCPECEFETRCKDRAVKDDDLSLLGVIPPKEIAKLRSKGIFTVTQLSYAFRPRRRKAKNGVSKVGKYHYALKALAIREKTTYIVGVPDIVADGTLVYLDVEGIPEQSFYYLIPARRLA